MGFKYEPCPWCEKNEKVQLYKSKDGRNYAQCKGCNMKLVVTGGSMMDCAKLWNIRASRRMELRKYNMSNVSLLHADINNNPEDHEFVVLENTDGWWKLVREAELSWNEDATPVRADGEYLKIKYEVLIPYLDALIEELAEKV